MTASPRVRSRARRAAAARAILGAALLVALLAGLPALRHGPAAPGGVRAGGVSIEWWYGGVLAPVAGWVVAVFSLRGSRVRRRAPDEAASSGAAASRDPG